MKKVFFLPLVLLSIISCSGTPHPKMISFTPASVVVDYSDNDLYQSTQLAQQFCSSIDKDAQYVRTEQKGWVSTEKIAYYNCIESSRKNLKSGLLPNQNERGAMPIINNFK